MRAKLSELGTVITGNTPSKQESKYWASSDIPFIKPDVINQDGITELQAANEYISEIARSKARIVEKSVVLVTCIGSIGKICLTGRECAFNQQINAIIPNDKVLPEYLAYCIYYNRPRLIELANAPVVPIINKRQFENFSVNIEENIGQQGSIVTILKAVDRLIYYRHKQLQKLDELVKARFVEMFGGIHNISKYPYKSIKELTDVISGGTPSRDISEYWDSGTIPWVKTTELQNNMIVETEEYITEMGLNNSSAKIVPPGTVLIAMYGQGKTRGMTAYLGIEACTNQACACILPSDKINQTFLWQFLILSYDNLRDKAKGGNQPNLNGNIIKNYPVLYPPRELQEQFAAFVEQTDKSKVAVQKALDEAQLLFDSLMQKYFE